jgi:hypothetical protein
MYRLQAIVTYLDQDGNRLGRGGDEPGGESLGESVAQDASDAAELDVVFKSSNIYEFIRYISATL